jgi:uncharacterized protein YrzB (UPF0473 family)
MSEDRDDILVLIDEDGEEKEFEYLDTIEMNGREYVVLIPPDEETEENYNYRDEEEAGVVIMRVIRGKDEEDSFESVDDEEELNSVFEEFKFRMEDDYEFDDDYEDEDEDEDYYEDEEDEDDDEY